MEVGRFKLSEAEPRRRAVPRSFVNVGLTAEN